MLLKNLKLYHFRNYSEQEITCSPSINIFWGTNAQGKSNLLEAIYYLGYGRSYRQVPDDQVIQWDYPGWRINAQIVNNLMDPIYQSCDSLDIVYSRETKKKTIRLNQHNLSKISNLGTIFPVVLFSPDDLPLVKGSPGERRYFLDSLLNRIYPSYYKVNQRYQRNLTQRNHHLRSSKAGNNKYLLETYDQELSELGARILQFRFEFLPMLSKYVKNFYREIAGEKAELSLLYLSSLPSTAQIEFNYGPDKTVKAVDYYSSLVSNFYTTLGRLRNTDRQRGFTSIGPHRDDLVFRLANKNLRQFGSQGQQRSLVLALRLSELVILENYIARRPVLLLDDVFSELDENRCKSLLRLLKTERQVFLTTTSLENLPDELRDTMVINQISNGTIKANMRLS